MADFYAGTLQWVVPKDRRRLRRIAKLRNLRRAPWRTQISRRLLGCEFADAREVLLRVSNELLRAVRRGMSPAEVIEATLSAMAEEAIASILHSEVADA